MGKLLVTEMVTLDAHTLEEVGIERAAYYRKRTNLG
jgi:hypothetical protein